MVNRELQQKPYCQGPRVPPSQRRPNLKQLARFLGPCPKSRREMQPLRKGETSERSAAHLMPTGRVRGWEVRSKECQEPPSAASPLTCPTASCPAADASRSVVGESASSRESGLVQASPVVATPRAHAWKRARPRVRAGEMRKRFGRVGGWGGTHVQQHSAGYVLQHCGQQLQRALQGLGTVILAGRRRGGPTVAAVRGRQCRAGWSQAGASHRGSVRSHPHALLQGRLQRRNRVRGHSRPPLEACVPGGSPHR